MNGSIDNIKGKNILVVGFGISGQAAAKALSELGARVSVQDARKEEDMHESLVSFYREKGVDFYLGTIPQDLSAYNMIVLSPGVSPELEFIEEARKLGVEITGELEIAYRICKGDFVAITGTNGKTTTTTLTGEIFKRAGRKTYVVGNIGSAAVTAAKDSSEGDWMVTEASSFELETTKYFKPRVSAILNLTPDHLNRHHTMEAYGAAKAKIFANQGENDYLVVPLDDKDCYRLSESCKAKVIPFSIKEKPSPGAYLDGTKLILDDGDKKYEIADRSELRIIGDHNVSNVLAASLVAFYSGISPEVISEAVKAFRGVEHRIEYVGEIDGVQYYNDSKGTNTDAAITAVNALEKDIILIAGGDAKEQNFDSLARELEGRVKKVILLGRDGYMVKEALDKAGFKDYIECRDMAEVVKTAHEMAEKGDKVLLSPACASWDMYDNYEQRGRHFKELVKGL